MKPTLRTRGGSEVVNVLAFDEASRIAFALMHDERTGYEFGYWLANVSADELVTDTGSVDAAVRRLARVVVREDTTIAKGRVVRS